MGKLLYNLGLILCVLALGPIFIDLIQAGLTVVFGVKIDQPFMGITKAIGFVCLFGIPGFILHAIGGLLMTRE